MSARVRWSSLATVPLALFGMGVGALLTWHHDMQLYAVAEQRGELIGCQESATVNCDIVNTSAWSEIGGVALGTHAVAAYAMVLVLGLAAARGEKTARTALWIAGVVAVAASAFLFWQSKVELGYVCAWCLRLYVANGALLAAVAAGGWPERPEIRRLLGYAALTIATVGVAGFAERAWRRTLAGDGPAAPVVAARAEGHAQDPQGSLVARSFEVQTEDGRQATLTLDADDPWVGVADGQATVVMFGDLECGFCKRSAAEIARLEATYGDRVTFVFKHFPMDPTCNPGVKNKKHRNACAAATAAVCAQDQGRFWAFHDLAYKNQHDLGPEALTAYARKAGVDEAAFRACTRDPATVQRVLADAAQGAALDIHGTPRIFVNGKLYRSGSSAEAMARTLEVALGGTAADAAKLRETVADVAPIPLDAPATRELTYGDRTFSIDTFEAAIDGGAAVSARHRVPALRVTWFEAQAACEKAGKRLCREDEWLSACQGARAVDDDGDGEFADDLIEGTAYPYGDYHEAGRCWDDHEGDEFRPVYTGESPGCGTAAGVYDLTGNLEEWVGDRPETAVLLGGAWDTKDDHARCYRRNDSFGAGYASVRTGFRCCSGP
jgi:protein-disulfide isomerase